MSLRFNLSPRESNQFFTGPERDIIERYLTPSYFESDFPNLDEGLYIQKGIWGREGRNIQVVRLVLLLVIFVVRL